MVCDGGAGLDGWGKTTLIRWTDTHDNNVACPAGVFITLEELHGLVVDNGGIGVVDGAVAAAVFGKVE